MYSKYLFDAALADILCTHMAARHQVLINTSRLRSNDNEPTDDNVKSLRQMPLNQTVCHMAALTHVCVLIGS
jgi:hypothetical protein